MSLWLCPTVSKAGKKPEEFNVSVRQWGRLTGTLMPSEGFETGDRAVCLQWLLMPILTHAYIPCICSTLTGRGKICLSLADVQLNKYERWSDGAMSGLSVPRAVSSQQNMAPRMWHSVAGTSQPHTHTQDSWLWSVLPCRHSGYTQNGAHMKQHKDCRDQNWIFHFLWPKVGAKVTAGVSQHLQGESVCIPCRWRMRHLNEITKWDGTGRGLGRFCKFLQFPLKKKSNPKSQITWIQNLW